MTREFAQVVAGVLNMPPEELSDEMGARVVDRWDSLRHLRIIAALEQAYGISFAPREIRRAQTVAALRALVTEKAGLA